MHINEESVFIYTDENNNAIVTELFNNSMPYINYINDDIITISDNYCECGRTSRVIEKIIGRKSGYIIKPDGSKINQFILMVIFYEVYRYKFKNSIRKFKIFQKENLFRIEIIPLENFNDSCKDYISKRMYEEIGSQIRIEFQLVDNIERDKSGKFRYFIRES
jgi:phenylacetate-CoA ligase